MIFNESILIVFDLFDQCFFAFDLGLDAGDLGNQLVQGRVEGLSLGDELHGFRQRELDFLDLVFELSDFLLDFKVFTVSLAFSLTS